jgi:cephalosporin hydroxylase
VKLEIDTSSNTLVCEEDGVRRELSLYSSEAFAALSRLWVKVGWDLKYSYGFTWMGRPIIQLPEDIVRIQETIYRVRPDVIIETGVAHGGSLILYASLCAAMQQGRVVGVDIRIRPENRIAIEGHELASRITLIEGSSIDPLLVDRVRGLVQGHERVFVILDSDHSRAHVAQELEAYAPLVSEGSYLVATDGIMYDLYDVPHGRTEWRTDNPRTAAKEFAERHPDFELEEPPFLFKEAATSQQVTHWPGAYLRRRAAPA